MSPESWIGIGTGAGFALLQILHERLGKWRRWAEALLAIVAVGCFAVVGFDALKDRVDRMAAVATAAGWVVFCFGLYLRVRRAGLKRRDSERRADEAEAETARTKARLEATEKDKGDAERIVARLNDAAIKDGPEIAEMLAIRRTRSAVQDLLSTFRKVLPEDSMPTSSEWTGGYEPQLRALLEGVDLPTASERGYRRILKELERLIFKNLPKQEHVALLEELERWTEEDFGRHEGMLYSRSNRLQMLVSDITTPSPAPPSSTARE